MTMRILLRSFAAFLACACLGFIAHAQSASASALTVCASGCTGTQISTVLNDASDGDTITVQGAGVNPSNPYNPATEAWPIQFRHASNTLMCAGGASIMQTDSNLTGSILMSTSSTLSDCALGNVSISTVFAIGSGSQSPPGIHILNNTFSTAATTTIVFSGVGVTDFVVSGNTNIQSLNFSQNATNTRGTVSNNTFRNRLGWNGSGVEMLGTSASTTDINFLNNTFSNVISEIGTVPTFFSLSGENIVFATNTILNPAQSVNYTAMGPFNVLSFYATGSRNYIGGNLIEVPTSTSADCTGIYLGPSPTTLRWTSTINVYQNSIIFGRDSSCTQGSSGITFVPANNPSQVNADLTLNASYNLIANAFGIQAASAINIQYYSASTSLTYAGDYNGVYGFGNVARKKVDLSTTTDLTGAHDRIADPQLRTANANDADDYLLAPTSPYLDVNGTQDIGAFAGTRRSTIYVDDNGTIDYSGVDATSTNSLGGTVRSGDTVYFAAGSYAGFRLGSSVATSSIQLIGAGADVTTITAGSQADALKIASVTSSVVSGFRLTGATDMATSYTSTYIAGKVGSQNYDEGDPGIEIDPGLTLVIDSNPCLGDFEPTFLATDGQSIPGLDGAADIHMVLVEGAGGGHLTILIPENNLCGSGSIYERLNGMLGEAFNSIDAIATSTFTAAEGDYTFQPGNLAAAGMSLADGVTNPAVITTDRAAYAGLHLVNSSIIGSDLIFNNNSYGAFIEGSGSSTLMSATSTGNSLYDLRHDGSTTSTLLDVSFLSTSTTFGGTAGFDNWYSARVRVTDRLGASLTNIAASTTPASVGSEVGLGATDGTGYTAFRPLLANRLNGASTSLTNAGKNPYTWSSGASGGYLATSTVQALSTPHQTITLAASQRDIGFASATASGLESVTATSIRVILSMTSGSPVSVNYAVTGGTATGSGTDYTLASGTATISAGETSTTIPFTVVDDGLAEGPETIIVTLSSPSGAVLATVNALTYTIIDNDTAGVSISKTTASVSESGTTDSYTVVLNTAPTSTTEVLVTPSNGQIAVSTSTIAFTTSNWSTPVTVTISALDDSSVEGDHASLITHTASSTNTGYNSSLSIDSVTVAITDNDVASSGGGGGGGGGGATSYIPTPIPVTPTPTTTNTTPVPVPEPVPVPVPVPTPTPTAPTAPVVTPASEATIRTLLADAKAFGVTLSTADQERIASFIEFGTSAKSRALGSGERRAVIRDVFETLGRAVSDESIEKLVNGQIPGDRNLAREQAQAKRALATFITIYGDKPTFSDPKQNLAWNTLMYRIRFPRDLAKEKAGILAFQKAFRKTPTDPFQWAVVRVMGYVK